MPNVKKELQKCKHPNSRKTISLSKKVKKTEKRERTRLVYQIKQNMFGEKVLWFKNHLPDGPVLNKDQILELIELYLSRYDTELEQIELKNSIGQRKSRQHVGREDIIKLTKQREKEEFETSGMDLPNFTDHREMETLRNWNGELRFLQNFKLSKFSRKHLV